VTANVTGMRNYFTKDEVFNYAYIKAVSNDKEGKVPDNPTLLKLNEKVVPLQEIVHVDYVIPGCPPSADTIFYVIFELLNDRIPNISQERKLKYG
jgi:NAD-reducing hydrogenase small subunit